MWRSERVVAGRPGYEEARAEAVAMARRVGVRAEWVDEYNDSSVAGFWRVRWA